MADTLDLERAVMRCTECRQRFGVDATFCPFDGTKLEAASWDPTGDPLLGRVIDGRYEVVGVLGEGGMGTVYQVRHSALDRLFAMKVLRRDLAGDPDLAARFMREARATASVKHPNIVAINDFGRLDSASGGVPYFVMEHLLGQTLAHAIKVGGALPAALGVRIALKIAGALGAAHAEKIVHRDLKPDNVFLLGQASEPGSVDIRVVDFGAALVLGASRVTKAGVVFGTPHYMSPEQASGQPVDHRADVYALGVIMYEIFTGRVPFVADTYMGVLTQHLFMKPIPPSRVSESARGLGAIEDIVLRALEKKPADRYATMEELAAEMECVSSFGPDGTLQVAPADSLAGEECGRATCTAARPAAVRPVYAMANALEPASREEVNAQGNATRARVRRAHARAWVTYGGIALGVAAVTLGAIRLLQPHHDAAGPPPAPVALATTPLLPSPSPPADSVTAPAPPPAGSTGEMTRQGSSSVPAVSPASASRSASRPVVAPARKAPPLAGDFADPWAK